MIIYCYSLVLIYITYQRQCLKTQRFSVTLGLSVRLLKMQVITVTTVFHKVSSCQHQEVFRVALFNPLCTFSNI